MTFLYALLKIKSIAINIMVINFEVLAVRYVNSTLVSLSWRISSQNKPTRKVYLTSGLRI